MRVVAGKAKGRRLIAPKGEGTRPTSDFVREAVFNSLFSQLEIDGARVADLFAGTGALGIEALSRGAASADFVESDRRALEAIRANLVTTGLPGATVHAMDVLAWLRRQPGTAEPFDVVFVDPPYSWDGWSDLSVQLSARVAVLESDREIDLGDGWSVLKIKKYGTTVVTLASPRSCP